MTLVVDAESADFGETWTTFCALDWTLGRSDDAIETWRRGRARYLVWVVRIQDRRVIERMSVVAHSLAGAIVPVPPKDAHVTVWVCGFPTQTPLLDDDVAESVITAQRAAASRVRPPRLLIGPPNAFATCAFLEIHDPFGDLQALRAALAVAGSKEVRFARYQPHVTVGRFSDTRPTASIVAALTRLRADQNSAPPAVHGCGLELIELDARAPERLTTVWPLSRDAPGQSAGARSSDLTLTRAVPRRSR